MDWKRTHIPTALLAAGLALVVVIAYELYRARKG